MRVERVAAGDHAVARRRGAVAEGAAETLVQQGAAGQHVAGQFRVGKHHAAQPYEVDPALVDHGLRHVGQVVLQVGVAAAYGDQVGEVLLDLAGHVQQAEDADQRLLWRQVAVGGGYKAGRVTCGL